MQNASISEMSLQDPWRAEFTRHSKGLLVKVCIGLPPGNSCQWLTTEILVVVQLNEAASTPEDVEHLLVPAVRCSRSRPGTRDILVAGGDGLEHSLWLSEPPCRCHAWSLLPAVWVGTS